MSGWQVAAIHELRGVTLWTYWTRANRLTIKRVIGTYTNASLVEHNRVLTPPFSSQLNQPIG